MHFCMFQGVYTSVASTSVYFVDYCLIIFCSTDDFTTVSSPSPTSAPLLQYPVGCFVNSRDIVLFLPVSKLRTRKKHCLLLHKCMPFTWFFITSYSNIYPSPRELFLTYPPLRCIHCSVSLHKPTVPVLT